MNARRLARIAERLFHVAFGGKHVDVRSLPDTIRGALRQLHFGRGNIEVVPAATWSVSTAFEGSRAIAVTVDIRTGRITDTQQGSWGGPNPWEDRLIDKGNASPVPNGSVVIAGESGGRGTFLRIYIQPSDLAMLGASEEEEVLLTPEEKKALEIIGGYVSGGRPDEFRREGIGAYSRDNPLIQSLAEKGLIRVMGSGIQITTKGRNLR